MVTFIYANEISKPKIIQSQLILNVACSQRAFAKLVRNLWSIMDNAHPPGVIGNERCNFYSHRFFRMKGYNLFIQIVSCKKAEQMAASCHSNKWIFSSPSVFASNNNYALTFKRQVNHSLTQTVSLRHFGVNQSPFQYIHMARTHFCITHFWIKKTSSFSFRSFFSITAKICTNNQTEPNAKQHFQNIFNFAHDSGHKSQITDNLFFYVSSKKWRFFGFSINKIQKSIFWLVLSPVSMTNFIVKIGTC